MITNSYQPLINRDPSSFSNGAGHYTNTVIPKKKTIILQRNFLSNYVILDYWLLNQISLVDIHPLLFLSYERKVFALLVSNLQNTHWLYKHCQKPSKSWKPLPQLLLDLLMIDQFDWGNKKRSRFLGTRFVMASFGPLGHREPREFSRSGIIWNLFFGQKLLLLILFFIFVFW